MITGVDSTPVPQWVRDDFAAAVGAVRVRSNKSAEVDGVLVEADLSGMVRGPAALADAVADALYRDWYLRVKPTGPDEPDHVESLDQSLVQTFRAAHAGTTRFETGWTVELASPSGRVQARRRNELRTLDRCDYVSATRPGHRAEPGDVIAASARYDHVADQQAVYWTNSPSWNPPAGELLTRVYFDVSRRGAPAFLAAATSAGIENTASWALKIQTHPQEFRRSDAAVLYVSRHHIVPSWPAIVMLASAAQPHVGTNTPRLALPIAAGVAVADGVAAGRSFGQVRSGLIADAIVTAALADVGDDERMAVDELVHLRFSSAGIDPARPYLDPGATLDYADLLD